MVRRKTTIPFDLASVPMFADCSKRELALVSRLLDRTNYPAGKTIFAEGDHGQEFYVVIGGRVSVARSGKKVAELGPGQSFGELALLAPVPRNATVTALDETEVLILWEKDFKLLLDTPAFRDKVLSGLARRLREFDKHAS